MIDKVPAYRTNDGQLFEKEQDAKDHEFELAFDVWFKSVTEGFDVTQKNTLDDIKMVILDERAKLLPIFKLLNGGNPVVAPPRSIPTEGQSNGE